MNKEEKDAIMWQIVGARKQEERVKLVKQLEDAGEYCENCGYVEHSTKDCPKRSQDKIKT